MAIIQGNAKQSSTRGFYPKTINGSLRFNNDDSARLDWTPSTTGNRQNWTWSGWVKRSSLGYQFLFDAFVNDDNRTFCYFFSDDTLRFFSRESNTNNLFLISNAVFRDVGAWYHIVFVADFDNGTQTERAKVYVNGEQVTSFSTATYPSSASINTMVSYSSANHSIGTADDSTGYFNYFDGYLANVHFIDGQALTADDFGELKNGVWVAKDYAGTYGTNGFYLTFEDDTQVEAFNTVLYRGNGGTQSITGVGFSPDLVWAKKRGSTAASHRLLDTVRGVQKNLYSDLTSAEQTQNSVISFDSDGFTVGDSAGTNGSGDTFVAWCWDAGANNAVTGHSSVTFTGATGGQTISGFPFSPDLVWIKERTDADAHLLFDSVRGPNKKIYSNLTNAETTVTNELMSFTNDGFILGSSGNVSTSGNNLVAWAWDAGDSDPVSNTDGSITSTVKASQANGFSIITYTGNGTAGATIGHGLSQAPDLIFTKKRDGVSDWLVYNSTNGANYGLRLNTTDSLITSSTYWNNTEPTTSVFSVGTSGAMNTSGADYIAYCWHDVTGKQKFGTYTGDGTTDGSKTITTGFRPGFLMIKKTSSAGGNWVILDGSRDPINNIGSQLYADTSDAEAVESGGRVEFTSTGFKLVSSGGSVNGNGETYIYAAFAGSYSDYITDYNTDGSIDSRVKANDTTGFSIVSYTGSSTTGTIGHGLSSAPDFILTKPRTSGIVGWCGYHSSLGETKGIFLELTNAAATVTDYWNNTAPTSSVFSVGGHDRTSGSHDYIAYCWAEKTGYSKFGSYTGTGASGNFITTGFKPSVVIVKRTDTTSNWAIVDSTRSTNADEIDEFLKPNTSDAEVSTTDGFVFTDTGFEPQDTGSGTNASGGTYIYAAFADTREAAFWLDQSGNDNDWQPVNLDHNDTVADSPTDNFATWNPLAKLGSVALPTFSDGNLTLTTNATVDTMAVATMGITSGTFYYEATLRSANTYHQFGVASKTDSITTSTDRVTYFGFNGYIYNNATSTSGYGTNSAGDVLGVACDADAGTVKFYRNGTLLSTESWTSNTGLYIPFMAGSNGTYTADVNFGQQPFKYTPPA